MRCYILKEKKGKNRAVFLAMSFIYAKFAQLMFSS